MAPAPAEKKKREDGEDSSSCQMTQRANRLTETGKGIDGNLSHATHAHSAKAKSLRVYERRGKDKENANLVLCRAGVTEVEERRRQAEGGG
jgi:hypothetical protein